MREVLRLKFFTSIQCENEKKFKKLDKTFLNDKFENLKDKKI